MKLDDDGESIELTDSNGNTVTLDSSGITLSNGGQQVVVADSSVSVNSGALEVTYELRARDDYAYPLRIDGGSQQAAQSPYAAHVEQMIEQILLTAPGERVDLPQFGCGLRQLVFAPMHGALDAALQAAGHAGARTVARRRHPCRRSTSTTSDDNAALEPGTVQVTVTYTLVDTQTSEQTTVTLP